MPVIRGYAVYLGSIDNYNFRKIERKQGIQNYKLPET